MKQGYKDQFLFLFVLLIFFGCKNSSESQTVVEKTIDVSSMDTTVDPGDDFYAYVVGGWQKRTTIPADRSSIWIGNNTIEKRENDLKNYFLNSCRQSSFKEGSIEQNLTGFYCTGVDSARREADGLKPLAPFFDKINSAATCEDIQNLNAYFQSFDIHVFFYLYSAPDITDSKTSIANIWQKGTCLPNLNAYLNDDSQSAEILADYENYISRLFELSGEQTAKAKTNAQLIIKMEKRFAGITSPQPDSSKKMTIEDLNKLTPGFNWDMYLSNTGCSSLREINVFQPGYLRRTNDIIKEFPVEDWKIFFRWNLLNKMAPYLNSGFCTAYFDYNIKKRTGAGQQKSLRDQVYASMKVLLRDALGQRYVQKYFPAETRIRITEMIANIKSACLERIEKSEWMSNETKTEAIAKLNNMKFQIGHPDVWPDFTGLKLNGESYVENVLAVQKFNFRQNIYKAGKPVNQHEWRISVMEPMAYNTATKNEIGFCAGLIFPPEYYQNGDDAVNYGALGSIIGHEIIHFFDNEGKMYDHDGNMKNWWNANDTQEYDKRANVLVEQYNKICVLDSFYINGTRTLDENIAELGGLAIAYEAYKMTLKGKPEPEKIDGFTDDQRFFIAYAMKDGELIRDEALIDWVRTNTHSPQKNKINGTLFNLDEFYEAFPEINENNKLFIPENSRAVIF